MKSIIVARVSTEEQKEAGNSLPAQTERGNRYCENKQFNVIKRFSFDETAYRDKRRDDFGEVVDYILRASKKEKVVVCFDKVDRLSRNIFDKRVALLYEKALKDEIELHFVSDNQIINSGISASDKFAFSMKLGLSNYFSDAISDNVRRSFEQKRRSGEWLGEAPLGYLNVCLDYEKEIKDIIIDPKRGHLIIKMFELYATGNYSLETIRAEITKLGLMSRKGFELSRSTVENIMKNSFYCGVAYSSKYDISWTHKYPRLISKELFDKCQEIRQGRRRNFQKFASRDYIFKGLVKCKHCGCTMLPETKTKKSGLKYTYYSCTNHKGICERRYIPEKQLLTPIYEVLERFSSISEEVQKMLVQELRKSLEAEVEFYKRQIKRIRIQQDEINRKKSRLLEMYIDGNQGITKDIYDKKNQEYQDEIQNLNIELEEYTRADHNYQTTVASVFSLARRAKEIFESSEVHEKRAFLNYLIQNPVVNGKKLEFNLRSPFDLVLQVADNPNWLRGRGSNPRPCR